MRFHLKSFFCISINILLISAVFILAEEDKKDTVLADPALHKNTKPISKQDSGSAIIDTTSDTTVSSLITTDTTLDTITEISSTSDSITGVTDSSLHADEPEIDTSYRVWNHPFWSFGIGWELGSMPVFDSWRSGLPEIFSDLTEIPDSLDSLGFSFAITNDPGPYNVNFPLNVSFTPLTRDDYYLSIKLIFSWMYKKFEASAKSDSVDMTIKTERKLSLLSLSLGTFFNYSIPSKYFLIDKTEKASITVGISASPLILLRNRITTGDYLKHDNRSYGIGVSWYGGLSTLRTLSQTGGLEVGIMYTGSWNGRFMHDGHHIKRGDINQSDSHYTNVLQYVSHRFIICFSLLTGKKANLKRL